MQHWQQNGNWNRRGRLKTLFSLIPDPEVVLSLEPEELAGFVLACLNSLGPMETGNLSRYNFTLRSNLKEYEGDHQNRIGEAVMMAWGWLEREGLVAPQPGHTSGDWFFVTPRGKRLLNTADFESFKRSNVLPKKLIHPVIAQKLWSQFLRGEYDTAVFQAYKEVEVAVRNASGFPPTDVGVTLMRKAFDKETGPLTDKSVPEAEREAVAHLFAGAIGSYKNPQSHRHVPITDPTEALEMIMLASHLLRIVDSRTGGTRHGT